MYSPVAPLIEPFDPDSSDQTTPGDDALRTVAANVTTSLAPIWDGGEEISTVTGSGAEPASGVAVTTVVPASGQGTTALFASMQPSVVRVH